MSDKTTGGISTERSKRRKHRHKQQTIRNLEHQIAMMEETRIPDKEDELFDLREELAAAKQQVELLRLELTEAENG